MSFSVTVLENATPLIRMLAQALSPEVLGKVAGQGVVNLLREHFQKLQDERPNKEGWPRQNFWDQVRRSIQRPQPTSTGVTVSIGKVGLAIKYFGGTIRPLGGKKYLTIPATAEAYGTRADERRSGDFRSQNNNLVFRFVTNRWGRLQAALVEAFATRLKIGRVRKDGTRSIKSAGEEGGIVHFWLTRQVTIKADETVLPKPEEIGQAAITSAENYLKRKIREKGGANG